MTDTRETTSNAYRAGYRLGRTGYIVSIILVCITAILLPLIDNPPGWLGPLLPTSLIAAFVFALFSGVIRRNKAWLGIAAFMFFAGVGPSTLNFLLKTPLMVWLFGIGAFVSATLALTSWVISGRRSRELDRFIFSESTSIAFFVTMSGAIAYSLAGMLTSLPTVPMWSVFSFGMLAWLVSAVAIRKKMT